MDKRTFTVRLYFTGIEAWKANKKLQEFERGHDWVVAEQGGRSVAMTESGFIAAKTFRKDADEAAHAAHLQQNDLLRKHSCELISPVLDMQSATDLVVISNMLEESGATCIDSYRTVVVTLDKPRKWGRAKKDCLVKTLTRENKLLYTLFAYSPLRQEFCDKMKDYPGWQEQVNKLAINKWYREFVVPGLIADNANIASTLHYRGLLGRCITFE